MKRLWPTYGKGHQPQQLISLTLRKPVLHACHFGCIAYRMFASSKSWNKIDTLSSISWLNYTRMQDIYECYISKERSNSIFISFKTTHNPSCQPNYQLIEYHCILWHLRHTFCPWDKYFTILLLKVTVKVNVIDAFLTLNP